MTIAKVELYEAIGGYVATDNTIVNGDFGFTNVTISGSDTVSTYYVIATDDAGNTMQSESKTIRTGSTAIPGIGIIEGADPFNSLDFNIPVSLTLPKIDEDQIAEHSVKTLHLYFFAPTHHSFHNDI